MSLPIYYLSVSTYIGASVSASHYYGRIRYDDRDGNYIMVDLERPISQKEASRINREEGWIVFRAGDKVRGFPSEAAVVAAAVERFAGKRGILFYGPLASADPMKAIAGDPAVVEQANSLYAAWESVGGWDGSYAAALAISKLWDKFIRSLELAICTP